MIREWFEQLWNQKREDTIGCSLRMAWSMDCRRPTTSRSAVPAKATLPRRTAG
jgi:hypothetical protein